VGIAHHFAKLITVELCGQCPPYNLWLIDVKTAVFYNMQSMHNSLGNNRRMQKNLRNGAMGIEELLKEKRDDILRIATQHGAFNVRVFGSVARGEATAESDIDFLVELAPERTLLDYIALIQAWEELLGCAVDVAETGNLHEAIREQVLQEAVLL
jgi:uncharacterized protein